MLVVLGMVEVVKAMLEMVLMVVVMVLMMVVIGDGGVVIAVLLGIMVMIVVLVIVLGVLFLDTLLGSITYHPSHPVGDVEVNLVKKKKWDGERGATAPWDSLKNLDLRYTALNQNWLPAHW